MRFGVVFEVVWGGLVCFGVVWGVSTVRTKTLASMTYKDFRVILMLTEHKDFQIIGQLKR